MSEFYRAVLSIDGDCACALLGPNIQEGEAEFVKIDYSAHYLKSHAERAAAYKALVALRKRLGIEITYAMGAGFQVH